MRVMRVRNAQAKRKCREKLLLLRYAIYILVDEQKGRRQKVPRILLRRCKLLAGDVVVVGGVTAGYIYYEYFRYIKMNLSEAMHAAAAMLNNIFS